MQGIAVIDAEISETGCVRNAAVIRSAAPLLDFAALRAVSQWRYTPPLLGNKPIPVLMTVTVNFNLQ